MEGVLTLISPAKINLFLRILYRRLDGFHELASLFQTIDLVDRLKMSLASRDLFSCSHPGLPANHSNLVVQAIKLFRKKTGIDRPARIHLEKHIPMQAGLGGGSGNGATALWGYNALLGKPVSIERLQEWAAELGSDVPFFLSQGTAYCTGRGELIEPISPFSHPSLWIIKPHQDVSTPLAYQTLKVASLVGRDPKTFLQAFISGDYSYFNDLEEGVFSSFPSLRLFKEKLLEGGFSTVLMSGSGSSFFCLGEGKIPSDAAFSKKVSFINRKKEEWYSISGSSVLK